MANSARVVVKKLYVGRMILFGIYFSILLGILAALVSLLVFMFIDLPLTVTDWMLTTLGTTSELTVVASIFILISVSVFIITFIAVLIYNLASKMHGPIHFQLEEVEQQQNTTPEVGMK